MARPADSGSAVRRDQRRAATAGPGAPATPAVARGRLHRILTGYPLVAVLLAVHYVLAVTSILDKSATVDEVAHLAAGYSYWLRDDYRLNPENGNWAQRWAALPLLAGHYRYPRAEQPAWADSNIWEIGHQFLHTEGNGAEGLLTRSRAAVALLGVALGLALYLWSRRLFGPAGGMISLALFVFNPGLLANGSLVTSDMMVTLFFLASAGCVWVVLRRVTPLTVLGSAAVMGGLFLAKMSAFLIAPVGLILLAVRLCARRPLPVKIIQLREVTNRWRQAGVFAVVIALHVAVVVFLLWASCGFRYSAFNPGGEEARFYPAWEEVGRNPWPVDPLIGFARAHHLLPESYLYGCAKVVTWGQVRIAFLNGEWGATGWRTFFPYAFLVKTPLAVFLVVGLALAAVVVSWRAGGPRATRWGALRAGLYRTAPLWVLLAVYWAVAISSRLNIGHRHILPVYPPLFVLAGAAAYWFTARGRGLKAVLAAALVAGVLEGVLSWPDYLAYFNPLAGGPRHGYRHLVDSSLDWGQDLPGLKRWLERNGLDDPRSGPVFYSYFGGGSPRYYRIRGEQLPGFLDCDRDETRIVPLTGGVYCISATMVEGIGEEFWGPWTEAYEELYQPRRAEYSQVAKTGGDPEALKLLTARKGARYWKQSLAFFDKLRIARLCAFLRRREPDAEVGYSILIYRLSDAEAQAAVHGPPPELAEKVWGQPGIKATGDETAERQGGG